MKSFLEEYGKIIILVLMIIPLLSFVFGRESGGFIYYLNQIKPEASVGTNNSDETLQQYSKRLSPEFDVKTIKLKADTEYDLLSFVVQDSLKGRFIKEVNGVKEECTEPLSDYAITITKITDPDGNELELPGAEKQKDGKFLYSFPRLSIELSDTVNYTSYRVTYELTDNHFADYPVKTIKTYQFVVD